MEEPNNQPKLPTWIQLSFGFSPILKSNQPVTWKSHFFSIAPLGWLISPTFNSKVVYLYLFIYFWWLKQTSRDLEPRGTTDAQSHIGGNQEGGNIGPLTLGFGISLHCSQESSPRVKAEPTIIARKMMLKERDNWTIENSV